MSRPVGGARGPRAGRTWDARPVRPTGPGARRWRWPVLALCALVGALAHRHQLVAGWGYTQTGTELLAAGGPAGGLHLYSAHPELQIGPLTFVAALPLLLLPAAARAPVLWGVLVVTGVAVVGVVTGWRPDRRVDLRVAGGAMAASGAVVAGGAVVAAAWSVLAVPGGHLDDVAALALSVAAVAARRRHHLVSTALLLAGAVDAKPWALAFAALLVDRDRPLGDHLRALAVFAAGVAVVWAPFLLADRDPASLTRLTIPDAADSALRVLGYHGPSTPPWDRPVQIAGGIAVGLLAVARRRPGAVLLAGLAVRLLLDPGTHTYYTAGLLLAALVFDVTTSAWRVPWTTFAGAVLLLLPHLVAAGPGLASARGAARAVATLAAVALAVAGPGSRFDPDPDRPAGGPPRRGLPVSDPRVEHPGLS